MPDSVQKSFAPVAANYATSKFHASKVGLQEVVDLAQPIASDVVLDIATGTGNTAFALAPHVRHVVGLDLTLEMIKVGKERQVPNVSWVLADAEAVPFADSIFDLVSARAAPHHFADLKKALAEVARVLRSGGRAIFIDCSPPAEARQLLHEVELIRDPSHVQSRTVEEWRSLIQEVGLQVELCERRELDWDFDDWMKNMNVEKERASRLASMIEGSAGKAREALHPERRDGKLFHAYWHALIRARKP